MDAKKSFFSVTPILALFHPTTQTPPRFCSLCGFVQRVAEGKWARHRGFAARGDRGLRGQGCVVLEVLCS